MSTLVDELPIICCNNIPASDKLVANNVTFNNENKQFLEQLTDRLEPSSYLIYGNGTSPICIYKKIITVVLEQILKFNGSN
jgi:hypothetical protein